jgi:cellulose synthase operon protein YhjQ
MNRAMRVATFQGLRGGVGCSSIVATLGDALHRQGEHVLMIDANPDDLLRLFFSVPLGDSRGWAGALSRNQAWHEQAYCVDAGMDLLPYGRNALLPHEHDSACTNPGVFWSQALEGLQGNCTWLLFDLPSNTPHYTELQAQAHLDIRVAAVDAGCHVHLAQANLPDRAWVLPSLYDPTRPLSSDILQEWRTTHDGRLVPLAMYRDEAVHEALGAKTTVQLLSPESMGARDASSLAVWCRVQAGALK